MQQIQLVVRAVVGCAFLFGSVAHAADPATESAASDVLVDQVNGQLQQEKLATMLGQMEDGVERLTDAIGDDSLDDIMADLDRETAGEGTVAAHTDESGVADVMNELDAAIDKGRQAAQDAQATGVERQRRPADVQQNEPEAGA